MHHNARIIIGLLIGLIGAGSSAAPLTILGEQFNEVESEQRLLNGGVGIPELGVIRTAINVPLTGGHTLVFSARVDEGKRPATLNVRVDGSRAGQVTIEPSPVWQTYTLPVSLQEGDRVFALEYDADFTAESPEHIQLYAITVVQDDRIPGLEAVGEHDFNRVVEYQQKAILADVFRRIETLRKGPLVIQVVDQVGMPVQDAVIDVRLIQPEFVLGINHCRAAFLLERPIDGHLAYQQNIDTIFSGGGVGEAMAWERMSPQPGTTESGPLKQIITFNRAHRWQTQSAALFKVPFDQWPEWTQALEDADLLAEIKKRMDLLINRSQGTLDPIILASDVIDADELGEIFDGQPIVGLFSLAEEIAPGKTFMITQSNGLSEGVRKAYVEDIENLLAKGIALQGIGLSLNLSESLELSAIEQMLDQLSLLNLPLYITGLSYSGSDSVRSAKKLSSLTAMIYSHPAVKSIYFDSLWNACREDHHIGWFTDAFEQTSLGSVMIPLLTQQWNSSFRVTPGPEGLIDQYVHYGEVEFKIQFSDGSQQTQTVLHHAKDAGEPTRVTIIKEQ